MQRRLQCDTPDGRGVVLETDDRVAGVRRESGLHDLHEAVWLRLAVNHNVGPKEPVPAVLTVALSHVKELHVGGVPFQIILEQGCVVLEVPVIECQT